MQTELVTVDWPLTGAAPLLPLEFLSVALSQSIPSLIDDCDAGVLGHCWNISARLGARREIRVFYRDVLSVMRRQPVADICYDDCISQIIPATRGLRGTELQRILCCGPDLVHDIDAAGMLEIERERTAARGPNASRLYTRSSIIGFLRSAQVAPRLSI